MLLIEKINILVVDDNVANIEALALSLEREEVTIFTTTSPKKVVQICIENDISIALIDVKMPEMDGFELLDAIKANLQTQHIMIILMTGYSMSSEHVVRGLSLGAVDYLFKPLDLYITIAKVTSLITLVNYQKEIEKKNKELEKYQDELFKAIEETEKKRISKENFLANMSHEIRTPLNAIIGLTYLLKTSPVNKDQQQMIKLMDVSSNALLGIVNDILESAKIDSGKVSISRTSTNISNLLETICDLTRPMANEKELYLTCEIDRNVPDFILIDSLRLNQILMNLINNAIKFTDSGGITIKLQVLEKKDENVRLEFIIKDSGIGIPKASIDRIFTRFEQVDDKTWQKFGGTGLGLSIVKKLVKLKGGTLNVESDLGAGTTFTFSNWYTQVEEIKNSVNATSEVQKLDDISILLVEDNQVNQYMVVEMLKSWNISVDIANNGLEAFEKIKTNNYKLILMDTHMPVMNGNEATRKIRKEMTGSKRNIPIISFSASVIEREKAEAQNAGVDDFIEKPFEATALVNKIRKLTNKKGTSF